MNRASGDNSDQIFDVAKKRFKDIGEELVNKKLAVDYKIDETDGLKFTVSRFPDGKKLVVHINLGGEVFSNTFDGAYSDFRTAYDFKYKVEVLNDLLATIRFYIKTRDYHEELYEKSGRTIFRKIVYANGSSESTSTVFAGRIRRYFGAKKRVVYPPKA